MTSSAGCTATRPGAWTCTSPSADHERPVSTPSVRPAGAGLRVRDAGPGVVTRRRLEMALGAIWLLDGALQFQPYMFTKAFLPSMLGMANMGLPGPVSALLYQVSGLVGTHPVFWNAAFASLQVLIGAGLLW